MSYFCFLILISLPEIRFSIFINGKFTHVFIFPGAFAGYARLIEYTVVLVLVARHLDPLLIHALPVAAAVPQHWQGFSHGTGLALDLLGMSFPKIRPLLRP